MSCMLLQTYLRLANFFCPQVDPNDTEASEELALAYARLQQYEKSANILERLVKRVPNDADAWRVGYAAFCRLNGMEQGVAHAWIRLKPSVLACLP